MTVNNLHVSMTPFENESRLLKETESLVAAGMVKNVYIVALHKQGLQERQKLDECREVFRLRLATRSWPTNFIVQMIKYLEFCWRTILISRRSGAKVFNVHSVALLPLGVVLKMLFRGILVYDAHELETETVGLRGFRKRAAKFMERSLIRYADLLIVVSPSIEDWYRSTYRGINAVTVLNAPQFQSVSPTSSLRYALEIPEHFRILLFQGGLSPFRGIEELVEAGPKLRDLGYAVVFMGYGPFQEQVEVACRAQPNLFFHPAVPPSELLRYTASADIGIASIRAGSLSYRLCLPNKLFEYLAAGIPVLASNLPEMRRVVESGHIGACIDEWDVESIAAGLKKIETMRDPALSARIKATAKQYSWENQEKVMIAAYRKLFPSSRLENAQA